MERRILPDDRYAGQSNILNGSEVELLKNTESYVQVMRLLMTEVSQRRFLRLAGHSFEKSIFLPLRLSAETQMLRDGPVADASEQNQAFDHPGGRMAQQDPRSHLVGGEVRVLPQPKHPEYGQYVLTPRESRALRL